MMKTIAMLIISSGIIGFFFYSINRLWELDEQYKRGYEQGYHDAKLIYECSHDRSECEILKDTL